MKKIIGTSAFTNGFYNKDRFLISLFFLFGIGILIGSVGAGRSSESENSILYQIYNSYITLKSEQSFLELFLGTFTSEFIFLFAGYVSGLCAIGIPILYLIPFIYGIGKGVIFGFLYTSGGFLGILNAFLFHSIQYTVFALLIIVSLKKSFKMSKKTFARLNSDTCDNDKLTLKSYNKFYIVVLIMCVLLCIIDALMFKINIFN